MARQCCSGISDFDGLHGRKHDDEVQLDAVTLNDDDLRMLPLSMRKTNLARLPVRRPGGVFIAQFERARLGGSCSGQRATWASKVFV